MEEEAPLGQETLKGDAVETNCTDHIGLQSRAKTSSTLQRASSRSVEAFSILQQRSASSTEVCVPSEVTPRLTKQMHFVPIS